MASCARLLALTAVFAIPFAIAPAVRADSQRNAADVAFSDGDPGSTAQPPAAEEEEREEATPRRTVVVSDFCGGGGDYSVLDEVQSLLDENRPAMARARLGAALHDGLQDWERPRGYAMAGEIALRIGSPERAVAWYRDALRVSEDDSDPTARLGLAVALLRSGRRVDASSTASSLLADECGEDAGGGDPLTCYGATLVEGLSAPTREARAAALERARTLREENPDYDEMFVDFHRLLPAAARAAVVRVASARD